MPKPMIEAFLLNSDLEESGDACGVEENRSFS